MEVTMKSELDYWINLDRKRERVLQRIKKLKLKRKEAKCKNKVKSSNTSASVS